MSSLPALSVASSVVGFISFGFTLAIWLNSFWDAFLTVGHADTEIQDILSILRQRLYEELEYIRRMRRREKSRTSRSSRRHHRNHSDHEEDVYGDNGPVRVLMDTVKDLTQDFKACERPFLVLPGRTGRKVERDLEWSFDATRRSYQCGIIHRLIWLKAKPRVMGISERLHLIQVQRAAVEATECRYIIADTMAMLRDCEDKILGVEEAVWRIEHFLRHGPERDG